MGISDDDYAEALKGRGNVTFNTSAFNTSARSIKEWIQQPIGLKPLRENDLEHEAMQAPLSSLSDMWTMRWGTQWVGEQEFMDDDFWRLALLRLSGAGKLEKHNLVNQYHSVYRIID
jgi:hypothetical protein